MEYGIIWLFIIINNSLLILLPIKDIFIFNKFEHKFTKTLRFHQSTLLFKQYLYFSRSLLLLISVKKMIRTILTIVNITTRFQVN